MFFILKKTGSIILVIIGTIIGAGFASGKEIDLFFFQYQKDGIYGLILSALILAAIIYMTFNLVGKMKIKNYEEFLKQICQKKEKTNKVLFYSIQLIIRIFLLISFYIMIAGFGAFFEQELGINKTIGIGIISLLCFYCFKKRTNGLVKVNVYLVPILILFIFYLGFQNTYNHTNVTFNNEYIRKNWILSAIIYSSYNSIILIPILITLGKRKMKNIQNIIISTSCFILIFLLGKTIYFLLFNLDNIQTLEIPTVIVASYIKPIYKYLFGIAVLISIFTSCVSCGYAFLEDFEGKKYKIKTIIICISAMVVSQVGFSNLVNLLYPTFGMLGLIQILLISTFAFSKRKLKIF